MSVVSESIQTDLSDGVLTVTLNRPEKKNAITQAMYEALAAATERCRTDDAIRVMLIRAEGDSFSAGNDIADFIALGSQASSPSDMAVFRFLKALADLDKPLVAAVKGRAVGIGTTLLLHCDLVIAADSARFYTAFINLGLVPEAGSSLILPALLGRQNANRLLLAGDTLTADEAERMGLVAYRCGDDELRDKALELGAKLAAKPPQALQYTKQLTRHGADAIREQIKKESVLFAERMFSDETRAIFDKFLNKK
ncbi:MAG TPA: enoyl-CoA hydratase [Brevundimonas sp.]|nr:enoyl-CoA hydratase [Brevundimonas sp.]